MPTTRCNLKKHGVLGVVLTMACLIGVVSCSTDQKTAPSGRQDIDVESKIKETGETYIRKHCPDWLDDLTLEAVVEDHGNYWEYTFKLPPDTQGGVPIILIDKVTYKIIKAYHTQ